jgi:hypothetical protein
VETCAACQGFATPAGPEERGEGLHWHQIADDIEGAAFRVIGRHDVLARSLHHEIARIRDAALAATPAPEARGTDRD